MEFVTAAGRRRLPIFCRERDATGPSWLSRPCSGRPRTGAGRVVIPTRTGSVAETIGRWGYLPRALQLLGSEAANARPKGFRVREIVENVGRTLPDDTFWVLWYKTDAGFRGLDLDDFSLARPNVRSEKMERVNVSALRRDFFSDAARQAQIYKEYPNLGRLLLESFLSRRKKTNLEAAHLPSPERFEEYGREILLPSLLTFRDEDDTPETGGEKQQPQHAREELNADVVNDYMKHVTGLDEEQLASLFSFMTVRNNNLNLSALPECQHEPRHAQRFFGPDAELFVLMAKGQDDPLFTALKMTHFTSATKQLPASERPQSLEQQPAEKQPQSQSQRQPQRSTTKIPYLYAHSRQILPRDRFPENIYFAVFSDEKFRFIANMSRVTRTGNLNVRPIDESSDEEETFKEKRAGLYFNACNMSLLNLRGARKRKPNNKQQQQKGEEKSDAQPASTAPPAPQSTEEICADLINKYQEEKRRRQDEDGHENEEDDIEYL